MSEKKSKPKFFRTPGLLSENYLIEGDGTFFPSWDNYKGWVLGFRKCHTQTTVQSVYIPVFVSTENRSTVYGEVCTTDPSIIEWLAKTELDKWLTRRVAEKALGRTFTPVEREEFDKAYAENQTEQTVAEDQT